MNNQTSTTTLALAYLAALATIAVLDGIWLGFVARDLYKSEMGTLLNESPRILPAALFYLIYPAGVVFLVMAGGGATSLGDAALRAGVVGLLAYGAYNGTNLSVIRDFPVRLSVIDLCWGTFLTAASGAAIYATVAARSGR